MVNLGEWASQSARILEHFLSSSSVAGVVFPPTPDGMASAAILLEIMDGLGCKGELIPSLPEIHLEAVERCAGICDSMIFLDLPPHGPGPLQVSSEFGIRTFSIDRGRKDLPALNQLMGRINLEESGISTSILLYELAVNIDEENDVLSWIALAGSYGRCWSEICLQLRREVEIGWPTISRDDMEEIRKLLLEAGVLGREWILLGVSSLRDSYDDPYWFLKGSSSLGSLIRRMRDGVRERIRAVVSEPAKLSKELGIWFVGDPELRYLIPLISVEERISKVSVAVHLDPPLAMVYAVDRERVLRFEDLISLLAGKVDMSFFYGKDFASIILDDKWIEDLLSGVRSLVA